MDSKSKTPRIRINKVYTRSGDAGKTHLIGGEKRFKDDVRVEAYGSVDELNSIIGLCRSILSDSGNKKFNKLIKILKSIQNDLFNLGTQLAVVEYEKSGDFPQLSIDTLTKLESEIDYYNSSLDELRSFVLPGDSMITAQFHIARNICRRAERRVITLANNNKIDPINLKYLNRLSDALFVWSRWLSKVLGYKESLWQPENSE